MRLRWVAICLFAVALAGAPIRLYLKDGTYHTVSEYKVLQDRVRYYSIERSDWEEIPTELVDLKKTQAEIKAKEEIEKKQTAESAAETAFEREQKREVALIPEAPGLFMAFNQKLQTFPPAEVKVATDKKRAVLAKLSPIPAFSGKAAVEIDGEQSPNVVEGDRPTFYFRLSGDERFAMVRCLPTKKKGVRVIENLQVVQVVKEIIEQREEVELFQQEVGPNLFRIWPVKPVAPGEYAVIQFTEGKGNPQTWDFRIK